MKTVFITGISRGLGKELFNSFAKEGFFVYGVLRNQLEADMLEKSIPKNSKIIVADLASDESIELIQDVLKNSPVELLINNAGIAGSSFEVRNVASSEVLDLFNIHCLGVLRTVKAMEGNLLKAENAIVLNLNSRLGSIARQSKGIYDNLSISYSYRIAKASQNMLTNCLRSEFKERIKFISLHPGKMKTQIASQDADLDAEEVASQIVNSFKKGLLKEENGITELGKYLIEW